MHDIMKKTKKRWASLPIDPLADRVIRQFGTVRLARAYRVSPSAVSQWRRKGIPENHRELISLMRPDLFGDAASL